MNLITLLLVAYASVCSAFTLAPMPMQQRSLTARSADVEMMARVSGSANTRRVVGHVACGYMCM